MSAEVERLAFDAAATLESLHAINKSRGLALDPAELLAVRDYFVSKGRLPTDVEVETIAQTWSEHCSHKTFRAKVVVDASSARPRCLVSCARARVDSVATSS